MPLNEALSLHTVAALLIARAVAVRAMARSQVERDLALLPALIAYLYHAAFAFAPVRYPPVMSVIEPIAYAHHSPQAISLPI
jgi:hypothetical protein